MNRKDFSLIIFFGILLALAIIVILGYFWWTQSGRANSQNTTIQSQTIQSQATSSQPVSLSTSPIPSDWQTYDSSETGSNTWASQKFIMAYPNSWTVTSTDTSYGTDIIFHIPLPFSQDAQLIISKVAPGTENYAQYIATYDTYCPTNLTIGGELGIESGGISGVGEGNENKEIAVIYDSPSLYAAGISVQLSADISPFYPPSATSTCIGNLTKQLGGELNNIQTAVSSLSVGATQQP